MSQRTYRVAVTGQALKSITIETENGPVTSQIVLRLADIDIDEKATVAFRQNGTGYTVTIEAGEELPDGEGGVIAHATTVPYNG